MVFISAHCSACWARSSGWVISAGVTPSSSSRNRIADHVAEYSIDTNEASARHIELGDPCCSVLENAEHFGFPLLQRMLCTLARSLGVDQGDHVVVVALDDRTKRREVDRDHQQDGPKALVDARRFRQGRREPNHDLNQRQPRRAGVAERHTASDAQDQEYGDESNGAVPRQDAEAAESSTDDTPSEAHGVVRHAPAKYVTGASRVRKMASFVEDDGPKGAKCREGCGEDKRQRAAGSSDGQGRQDEATDMSSNQ